MTGYEIYRKSEGEGKFSLLASVDDETTCFLTSDPIQIGDARATAGYFVIAVDGSGGLSPYGQVVDNLIQTVADFEADTVYGAVPAAISFTDLSLGEPTSWSRDFQDDGVVDSTEQSPSFTYTEPGLYNVSLEASGPYGTDTRTRTLYIEVLDVASEGIPSDLALYDDFSGPALSGSEVAELRIRALGG
ncbi:MAG: PKD domain-containing protein [Gammaproteobacteria bacterium]|nr:PKD domain-containing protein [Gammaproteobacteria bacterium]